MTESWFSPRSFWRVPLGAATVHANSATYVAELLRMREASHGSALNIPWVPGGGRVDGGWTIQRAEGYSTEVARVTSAQARVSVKLINYGTNAVITPNVGGDRAAQLAYRFQTVGVPIPSAAAPASGADQHLAIVNPTTGEYHEFWHLRKDHNWGGTAGFVSGWAAHWGGWMPSHFANPGRFETSAVFGTDALWGAAATSLPLLAGLAMNDEIAALSIPHALHIVLPDPLDVPVWPAQRADGDGTVIPEGSRFRIKASVNVEAYTAASSGSTSVMRAICRAMQTYGAIVSDKSSPGNPMAIRAEYLYGGSGMASIGTYGNLTMKGIPTSDLEFVDVNYRAPYTPPNTAGERWGVAA